MERTLKHSMMYSAISMDNKALTKRSISVSCACLVRQTYLRHFQHQDVRTASSAHAGDLAIQAAHYDADMSDEEDEDDSLDDSVSLGAVSECSSSVPATPQKSTEQDGGTTYAEALWDHVTFDPDELPFRAGDVVEVTLMEDKDWWWGIIGPSQGWFPAAFVRICANQADATEDFVYRLRGGSGQKLSQEQGRTNVITEILQAEREYVQNLQDVVIGYLEKAQKRPEMFPEECLSTIFCNINDIYLFTRRFLKDLEAQIVHSAPHLSNIGQCFLNHARGFEIYSEYCNNHPMACEELRLMQKNKKYQHFWEACRLLQQMIEIPLEGFLLTPVQKICKYPLQLKELLKYTPAEHPDHVQTQRALDTMHHIATLINERKRKMESLEKLAQWQSRVEDWEEDDLIDRSSELITSGEMTKVNSSGWHQDRQFFLFDHQLVYCKKDLLWRDLLVYKGRIDLDHCEIQPQEDPDSSDTKHGFRIIDHTKNKTYILFCRNAQDKQRWLQAFQDERRKVRDDNHKAATLNLANYRNKIKSAYLKTKGKKPRSNTLGKEYLPEVPSDVNLQHRLSTKDGIRYMQTQNKQRTNWFPFLRKKSKR